MRAVLFSLVMLVFGALSFVAVSSYLYRAPGSSGAKTVMIQAGTGTRAILDQLHAEGLTPPMPMMVLPVLLSGVGRQLKTGEYAFAPGISPAMIIRMLARGEIVVHKITVPEGWTSFQVRAALESEPLLTGTLPETIAEGSILPDTVRFTRGEPRMAVLARLQRSQREVLLDLWHERDRMVPLTTPEEALVLASIIEKETGVAEERALVAGVFVHRLRLGMPLQSDPTVAYGISALHHGEPMARALTTADLTTDTVYNSYTRLGLPPTPICNPGRKAIEAALHPAMTDALYFVANGKGGHHFAQTLKEHEENVRNYRKHQR